MIRSLLGKKFPVSRLALTLGVSSSLLALGNAAAQQVSNPTTSQAPETAQADRVIVTGSNIPTSEEVGAAPVDTIDQATRDRTGQEDVESVLVRSNPAISSGGGNLGQSNAGINQGATLGGSTIAIHGLPTLILLDGRRLTDSSASAVGSTFSDVNLFPSALVKRIEVLKDGASAIYGTEAVGGVVNVILDQEFQGFEFSARYGFTEKSDVRNQRYSAVFGVGDDKTHIVVGGEYTEQDPLLNSQRDFSSPSFATTTYAGIVRFATAGGSGLPPTASNPNSNGEVYYRLAPGLNSPNDVVAPGSVVLPTGGLQAGFNPLPGVYIPNGTTVAGSSGVTTQGFDLSGHQNLTLDQNRTNVFASADRELIGKHVVAFTDFLYAKDYSQSFLNAQPVATNAANGITIPAGSPYNPFTTDVSPTNATVALGENRFVDQPRVFRSDTNFFRVVAGLKGEIIPNYNYEVAFNSSQDETSFKNPGLIIAANLNQAIAGGFDAAGNAVAGGKYSVVSGNLQPALDFFARNPIPGSTVGISGDQLSDLITKFQGFDGKITAFPFNLPAGPVGFAAGYDYRHETIRAENSPNIFVNASSFNSVQAGRQVLAGFAETQIPLISPDMKVPFLYRADIDGAGRYEAYSPGPSTWVPKVGFDLSPIKDITLRGTFSKSFIAPTLFETQGPTGEGSTSSFDLGGGSEQANQQIFANPGLGNTTADTYTAGIVISPHQLEGLTINLDFFHVEEKGTVTTNAVQAIQSVNAIGAASPFNLQVHQGSFTGPLASLLGVGGLAGDAGDLYVNTTNINSGGQRIGGVDFGVHYNRDFGTYGMASVGIDGTYYLQYKIATSSASQFYDVIGFYTGQANATEQYHLTPQVAYTIRGFTASAIGNYIPSLRDAHNVSIDPTPGLGGVNADKPNTLFLNTGQSYLNKIRDYFTVDLLFSYEFGTNRPSPDASPAPKDGKDRVVSGKDGKDGKTVATSKQMADSMLSTRLLDGLKLSFGVQDVNNARPPLIVGSPDSTNTDAGLYDAYQRQYYFVISKKF